MLAARGQETAPPPETAKADYSKEASIVESYRTALAYEDDGTGTRQISARVKVQSDAGVQQYGLLVFGYVSGNEELQIDYVRVRKPDGSRVETPAESVQDMPSEVTRVAPMYSDYREKHVAVRGLSAGDTLEYQIQTRVKVPFIPGQFWYADDFFHDSIVLDQELEVSFPKGREVKVKSTEVQPTIREEGNRRIYLWKTANLERKEKEEVSNPLRGAPPPAVQLTTFRSWEEIGRWWESLELPQAAPTPEIVAKAAELTRDAKTDDEKVRAIYNYVSTHFRYISISFGMGRYQPHAAAEVLDNSYGDCKDKVTLLASLLQAAGIKSYPALINSARQIDPDVPSPAQFDHVISVVPQGQEQVWLDTTPEVAPFGMLLANLRDKPALVIPPGRPATLEQTPAEPPFPNTTEFQVAGKLDDSGTLQVKINRTFRGDTEVLLRAAFRTVPQAQWKDLAQRISYASNFAGDVSNVTASSPVDTTDAFRLSYDYTRKDYPDWTHRRIRPPCPPYGLPTLKDEGEEKRETIELGGPLEFVYEGKVTLPAGYTPRLPDQVELKNDFGEYDSTYSYAEGTLHARHKLVINAARISKAKFDEYRDFYKAVNEDEGRFITFRSTQQGAGAEEERSPEALALLAQARAAFLRHDVAEAEEKVERVVKTDPNYGEAWAVLGGIRMEMSKPEEALEAFRKAVALDPKDPRFQWTLAVALGATNRSQEAIRAFRDLLQISPNNAAAHGALATLLYDTGKYAESAAEYEKTLEIGPPTAFWLERLAWAYLQLGEADKAVSTFDKALPLDSQTLVRNNFAYELATKGLKLDKAREYAEDAVREEEKTTATLTLEEGGIGTLAHTRSLAYYWDTLGWICYLQGDLTRAERYLFAAWKLQQNNIPADHLGQVYEKQGKTELALQMYAAAVAIDPTMPEESSRLGRLAGTKEHADAAVAQAREDMAQRNTVKLAGAGNQNGSAKFLVLLAAGPKVEEVKFLDGPDDMRSLGKTLTAAKFDVVFPDDTPMRLAYQGTLSCAQGEGCNFVITPLESTP